MAKLTTTAELVPALSELGPPCSSSSLLPSPSSLPSSSNPYLPSRDRLPPKFPTLVPAPSNPSRLHLLNLPISAPGPPPTSLSDQTARNLGSCSRPCTPCPGAPPTAVIVIPDPTNHKNRAQVNPLSPPPTYYVPLSSVMLAEIDRRRSTHRISGCHRCWDLGPPP
jgi:hypothetical protein